MYFGECEKAFINGEKVGLSNIGVLQPKVHACSNNVIVKYYIIMV